jgi:hypothetical protein
MMHKKNIIFVCLSIIFLTLNNAGCLPLIIGGAAAGGYEVSPDSVSTHFNTSFSRAYSETLTVLRSYGKTTMEDAKGGWVKVEFENYKVAAHIEQLTSSTIKITISCRRYTTPRVQKAKEILDKISLRLK